MKRNLLIAFMALLAAFSASAVNFTYDNITYTILDDDAKTVAVYSVANGITNLLIPEKAYNGETEYTVTAIADMAFFYVGLTSVSIPNTVTTIGTSAFEGCTALSSMTFGNSVDYIGSRAFSACSSLVSLTIPNSVNTIGAYAFQGCTSLTSVTVPNSVTTFGTNPFMSCTNLEQFTGDLASEDGNCLVYNGTLVSFAPSGITNYSIPNTLTAIGENAFSGCNILTSIVIPSTISAIGASPFYNCTSLTSVEILSTEISIGNFAFQNCTALTAIRLPDVVTSIGTNPFDGCSNLAEFSGALASEDKGCLVADGVLVSFANAGFTTYSIPAGVTSIGEYAFNRCNNLVSVNMPLTVASIGASAFYDCSALKSVGMSSTVSSIGDYAFRNCTSLESIEIPREVTSIGKFAFGTCTGLKSVKVYIPTPLDITTTAPFDQVQMSLCGLYVPNDKGKYYSIAEKWKEFSFISEFNVGTIQEETNYTNTSNTENATVYYTRTFPSYGFYAIYLPYEMKYEDWATYGNMYEIYNVHQYDVNGDGTIDRTTIEFYKMNEGNIDAHIPYVFRPKEEYVNQPVTFVTSGCTLYAKPATNGSVDCCSTKMKYTMTGNYAKESGPFADNVYALSTKGKFTKAADDAVLNPYRFKLVVESRTAGSLSALDLPGTISMSIDGEIIGGDDTTDVINIATDRPQDDNYYDLLGRRVLNPGPGLYIHQGKKIYITK